MLQQHKRSKTWPQLTVADLPSEISVKEGRLNVECRVIVRPVTRSAQLITWVFWLTLHFDGKWAVMHPTTHKDLRLHHYSALMTGCSHGN